MTIAIALAVIAVVAVAGVWVLRRQAGEQRDGGPAPHIEDGPPAGAEEGAEVQPAADFPWREPPRSAPATTASRRPTTCRRPPPRTRCPPAPSRSGATTNQERDMTTGRALPRPGADVTYPNPPRDPRRNSPSASR